MKRITRFLSVLALGVVPGACVQLPTDTDGAIVLSTHVNDWRDEVIYQLLVDRFADGDVNNDYKVQPGSLGRYQGGDWKGVEDHLDYLQELGVTTIWLSPVVRNVETDADVDGYHGYWAQDLSQTNPHFGDLSALRSMINAAHNRDMKVVLDIVTNHMGQVFFYDINHNGKADIYIGGTGSTSPVTRVSEFDPDWDANGVQSFSAAGTAGPAPIIFIQDPSINRVPPPQGVLGTARGYHGKGRILDYSVPAQTMLGDFPGGLKDVATELPEVRAQMIESYARWVELADFDGFRIDTVKHVEHEFWKTFTAGVRTRLAAQGKSNFLMFGEAFDGDDALLGSYTVPGELDSVFYFSQHFQVFRDLFEYAHDPAQQKGTDQVEQLWTSRFKTWSGTPQDGGVGLPPNRIPVNFLDNHDVPRFLFDAGHDVAALRNALTLLATEEGIPCIYYGTEQDFAGGNDPANREVLWNSGFATTGDTFRHLSKVLRLRKTYQALRHGATKIIWSSPHTHDEEDAGLLAYERADGTEYALAVFNTNGKKQSGALLQTSQRGVKLVDVLDPKLQAYTTDGDGKVHLSLAQQTAMILVPAANVVNP